MLLAAPEKSALESTAEAHAARACLPFALCVSQREEEEEEEYYEEAEAERKEQEQAAARRASDDALPRT